MDTVNTVFDLMDKWRDLPDYQLERRSDIFFAIYLSDVLKTKYEKQFSDHIIPEFPVRIGTVDDNSSDTNRSIKIDYLAFTQDYSEAFLIELKTDINSRRKKQDCYLLAAKERGFTSLLQGLIQIFEVTKSKNKYFHLFKMLENAGIVELPRELQRMVFSERKNGIIKLIRDITITKQIERSRIVYIQPKDNKDISRDKKTDEILQTVKENIITYNEFARIIGKLHDHDSVTLRFVRSLELWDSIEAGAMTSE